MKGLVVLHIICITFTIGSSAQSTFRVEGFVYDSLGVPVSMAGIHISSLQHSEKYQAAVTDTAGFFSITGFPKEKFIITVKCIGFKSYRTEYHYLPEGNKFLLNDIFLQRDIQELKEVIIQNSIPAILVKEDTIEYKADSFRVKTGDDLEALLKKLPGLKVNRDGTILAQGQPVKKIKVNGKEFFGSDPQAVAKNLPAEIVDKVQVIDDYGETASFTGFKTGNSEKIINIQLKKDKNEGRFGQVEAGYGSVGRYSGRANFNHFTARAQTALFVNTNNIASGSFYTNTAGFGSLTQLTKATNTAYEQLGGINNVISIVNNRDIGFVTTNAASAPGINTNFAAGLNHSVDYKKLTVYGSLLSNVIRNTNSFNAFSRQFFGTDIIHTSSTANTRNRSAAQRLFLNAEYTIDSLSLLKFTHTWADNQVSESGNYRVSLAKLLDTLNYSLRDNLSDVHSSQFINNLLYKRKFRKYGRSLLIETGFIHADNGNTGNHVNTDIFSGSAISNQKNRNNGKSRTGSLAVNYTEAILKRFLLNLRAGIGIQQDNMHTQLYNFDSNQEKFVLNTINSGHFISRAISRHFGMDIKYKHGKFTSTAGLGGQSVFFERQKDTTPIGSFRQHSFTPRASLSYKHNQNLSLTLRYTAFLNSPESRQLSPFRDTLNPLVIFTGNPFLKAELIHKTDLLFSNINPIRGNIFLLAAALQSASNKIVQDVVIDAAGRQMITYRNAQNFTSAGVYYNFSVPLLNKFLEITAGGNTTYSRSYYVTKGDFFPVKNLLVNQFMQATLNPAVWLELDFGHEILWNRSHTGHPVLNGLTSTWFGKMLLSQESRKASVSARHTRFDDYFTGKIPASFVLDIALQQRLSGRITVRAELNDAFNNSSRNIVRSIAGNSITDSNMRVIGRYFMISFSYKFSRFNGTIKPKKIQED